jgi:hypothetical protein
MDIDDVNKIVSDEVSLIVELNIVNNIECVWRHFSIA